MWQHDLDKVQHPILLEIDIQRGQNCGALSISHESSLRGKTLGCAEAGVSWDTMRYPASQTVHVHCEKGGGGEYGKEGLIEAEISILHEDDVLLWRMVFLAMASNYIKSARGYTLLAPKHLALTFTGTINVFQKNSSSEKAVLTYLLCNLRSLYSKYFWSSC